MKDFRNLDVWRKAHNLTLTIYRVTNQFPKHELYGLTSQIRGASASIACNIAEGCGRGTDPELRRFMEIAMGSASEVEYQCLLAFDLQFIDDATFQQLVALVVEVKKMLASFIRKLKADR
jgi:four helix bundle protein